MVLLLVPEQQSKAGFLPGKVHKDPRNSSAVAAVKYPDETIPRGPQGWRSMVLMIGSMKMDSDCWYTMRLDVGDGERRRRMERNGGEAGLNGGRLAHRRPIRTRWHAAFVRLHDLTPSTITPPIVRGFGT